VELAGSRGAADRDVRRHVGPLAPHRPQRAEVDESITVHSGGADFSVFTGMVVGGLAYLILGWKDVKRQVPIQQELLRDQGIA